MIELADPAQMLAWSRARRADGDRVGLVPTMGYLHEAHLRLVDRARELADVVVISAFVNPLQFGPHEDFDRYPRDPERDRELAVGRGVDCLFAPTNATVYPCEPAVRLDPGPLARHLCGPHRPGHFAGVLMVVAKLFHMVEPHVAVFGRKDAQQAEIIRRMVQDLDFPVTIDVAPTVREPDGLALSSRNAYLKEDERRAAAVLARGLDAAHDAFVDGTRLVAALLAKVREAVDAEPALRLQYVEAVDPVTLQPMETADERTLLALAAFAGNTRLIDNIVLGEGTAADIWLES